VMPDAVFQDQRRRIVDLAAKSRLPAMYPWREAVEAGGLMAYGASGRDILRRAAAYVDKILKGAKPGDLPVEDHRCLSRRYYARASILPGGGGIKARVAAESVAERLLEVSGHETVRGPAGSGGTA